MDDRTRQYREQQRVRMIYRTPHKNGKALCHRCGEQPGCQMHEIVNRAQTSSSEEALRLSFTETLCSWLCIPCHMEAPTYEVEQALWLRNIRVYGLSRVLADLDALAEALGVYPIISFPEIT